MTFFRMVELDDTAACDDSDLRSSAVDVWSEKQITVYTSSCSLSDKSGSACDEIQFCDKANTRFWVPQARPNRLQNSLFSHSHSNNMGFPFTRDLT